MQARGALEDKLAAAEGERDTTQAQNVALQRQLEEVSAGPCSGPRWQGNAMMDGGGHAMMDEGGRVRMIALYHSVLILTTPTR